MVFMSHLTRFAEALASLADRMFGQMISERYQLSKMRSYLYHLSSLEKEPLLVYQMGKVGSTTIVNSLEAAGDVRSKYSIYHVHWLSPDRLLYEEELYKQAKEMYSGHWLPAHRFHPGYVWLGERLSRRILLRSDRTKWTIVTLLREPISRNISSFFQNVDTLLSYDYRSKLRSTSREMVVEDLRRLFDKNYLHDGAIEQFDANPLTWFDTELKSVFDVDVYSSKFPTDKGYATYDTPRARVLLLRLEDLARNHSEAFKTFLHITDFTLVTKNTGRTKEYSDLYEAFVRDLVLPTNYLDKVYESKYTRHFYTEQEIERFRARWRRSK